MTAIEWGKPFDEVVFQNNAN
ncbi:hypothetical protein EMIT0P260_80095 [Pseudomonas sp. IT-P260]